MIITKTSPISNQSNSRDINITQEQLDDWNNSKHIVLIQRFFPHLSEDDREFLLTGITPEEWDATFKEID